MPALGATLSAKLMASTGVRQPKAQGLRGGAASVGAGVLALEAVVSARALAVLCGAIIGLGFARTIGRAITGISAVSDDAAGAANARAGKANRITQHSFARVQQDYAVKSTQVQILLQAWIASTGLCSDCSVMYDSCRSICARQVNDGQRHGRSVFLAVFRHMPSL